MFLAIQQGYFSKAIDYIESADNVDIRDEEGKTPLIRCILLKDQQKAIGLARALLAHGATISQRDKDGLNALHYSCIARLPHLVDLLLASLDCDVNVRCRKTGNTALHFSVMAGDEDISRKLVTHIRRYELNIDVLNKDGETALELAFKFNNNSIANLLISSGANVKLTSSAKPGLQPELKINVTAPSTASSLHRSASSTSHTPRILKRRKRSESVMMLHNANSSNSMRKSMTFNRAKSITTVRIIEPANRPRRMNGFEVSWREVFPIIWSKYAQQNSASFRKPANFEEGVELQKQLSEQGNAEVSEEVMLPPTVPRRRNSSMPYLGPPVSRRGSLFHGIKGQPSKVEMMRARRQSVAV